MKSSGKFQPLVDSLLRRKYVDILTFEKKSKKTENGDTMFFLSRKSRLLTHGTNEIYCLQWCIFHLKDFRYTALRYGARSSFNDLCFLVTFGTYLIPMRSSSVHRTLRLDIDQLS